MSSRVIVCFCFFFSSRRRHTRLQGDWSSDVCSSDLADEELSRERVPDDRVALDKAPPAFVRQHDPVARVDSETDFEPRREIGRASCRERVKSALGAVTGRKKQERQGGTRDNTKTQKA